MPRATRKSKVPLNPNIVKKTSTFPIEVQRLAGEYGIDPAALLDWKVYPSGKVVLIAPNGMKLVREMDALEVLHPTAEQRQGMPADKGDVLPVEQEGAHGG